MGGSTRSKAQDLNGNEAHVYEYHEGECVRRDWWSSSSLKLWNATCLEAYEDAIFGNKEHFQGQVILCVGRESDTLACLVAMAGATKGYAVEYDVGAAGRSEVEADLGAAQGVVTLLEGKVEELELPEKVDIIVSNFMGNFLLGTGCTIDSFLLARDKFLKSDGTMFPSHCEMVLAPASSQDAESFVKGHTHAYERHMREFFWSRRKEWEYSNHSPYRSFERKVRKGFPDTSVLACVGAQELLGPGNIIREIDMRTARRESVRNTYNNLELSITIGGSLSMIVGWFSVYFNGSQGKPALVDVEIDTSPYALNNPMSFMWQKVFVVPHLPRVDEGGTFLCSLRHNGDNMAVVCHEGEKEAQPIPAESE